jgi:hypothetical protein
MSEFWNDDFPGLTLEDARGRQAELMYSDQLVFYVFALGEGRFVVAAGIEDVLVSRLEDGYFFGVDLRKVSEEEWERAGYDETRLEAYSADPMLSSGSFQEWYESGLERCEVCGYLFMPECLCLSSQHRGEL